MADRKERNKAFLELYTLSSFEAGLMGNNRKLARLTAVRVSNHIARRLGAFYQGLHWTGIQIKPGEDKTERLKAILDQRSDTENFLMDKLRDHAALGIAVCEIDDPVAVLGGDAYEIAHLNWGARRRLYQAIMVLGRLETFLWFLDHGFKPEHVRTIMTKDTGWRGVCRLLQKQLDSKKIYSEADGDRRFGSGYALKQQKAAELEEQYHPPLVRTRRKPAE